MEWNPYDTSDLDTELGNEVVWQKFFDTIEFMFTGEDGKFVDFGTGEDMAKFLIVALDGIAALINMTSNFVSIISDSPFPPSLVFDIWKASKNGNAVLDYDSERGSYARGTDES